MTLFITSFILAIAFCAPPGVITAETIRRGLARGFFPALLVQLGSLIGDTTWAIIALTGLAFVVENDFARSALSIVGVALMLKLARNSFKDAQVTRIIETNPLSSNRSDFANGAVLSLGNPLNIVFWTGLGTTVFATIPGSPQPVHFTIFFAGFLSGAILWCFVMAGLVAWGRQFLDSRFFRGVNLVCGAVLVIFAAQLGMNLLRNLIG